MFVFKKDKPTAYESVYEGFIKRRKTLKNGWRCILLKNNVVVLFDSKLCDGDIVAGQFKKLIVANDGKFMLVLKTGEKAIYDKNGNMLTLFNKQNELFLNGWYRKCNSEGDGLLTLYDAAGNVIGEHLRKAEVYKDGRYYMSVAASGDGNLAGLFNADGTKIFLYNGLDFKMLKNGWFVTKGNLYDNTGAFFIGAEEGLNFSSKYLTLIGSLMLKRRCQ